MNLDKLIELIAEQAAREVVIKTSHGHLSGAVYMRLWLMLRAVKRIVLGA